MGHVSTFHKAPFCKENHQKRTCRNRMTMAMDPRPKFHPGSGLNLPALLGGCGRLLQWSKFKQASSHVKISTCKLYTTHHESTTSDMHLKIENQTMMGTCLARCRAKEQHQLQNWVIPARHVSTSTSHWLESRFVCFREGVEGGGLRRWDCPFLLPC